MLLPFRQVQDSGEVDNKDLHVNVANNTYFFLYTADKKDYTFRSFWDREDCFRILTAFLSKFRGVEVELPPPRPRQQDGMRKSTMSASSHGHDTGLPPVPENESAGDDVVSKHQSLPVSSSRKANLAAPLPLPPPAPRKLL